MANIAAVGWCPPRHNAFRRPDLAQFHQRARNSRSYGGNPVASIHVLARMMRHVTTKGRRNEEYFELLVFLHKDERLFDLENCSNDRYALTHITLNQARVVKLVRSSSCLRPFVVSLFDY